MSASTKCLRNVGSTLGHYKRWANTEEKYKSLSYLLRRHLRVWSTNVFLLQLWTLDGLAMKEISNH